MRAVLTNTTMMFISQYLNVSSQYVVHIKLIVSYVNYISKEPGKNKANCHFKKAQGNFFLICPLTKYSIICLSFLPQYYAAGYQSNVWPVIAHIFSLKNEVYIHVFEKQKFQTVYNYTKQNILVSLHFLSSSHLPSQN